MSYAQAVKFSHNHRHDRRRQPITLGAFGPEKPLYDFICSRCNGDRVTYNPLRKLLLACHNCVPDYECICGFTGNVQEINEHTGETGHIIYRHPFELFVKEQTTCPTNS